MDDPMAVRVGERMISRMLLADTELHVTDAAVKVINILRASGQEEAAAILDRRYGTSAIGRLV